MRAKLVVTGGKASRNVVSLKLPVVVGRSRGAGLTIAHPMVSRQHCEIFESGGILRIRDLGSTNGTYVDGNKIEEAVLRPREQFTIGPLTFEVDYEYAGDATLAEENREEHVGTAQATEAILEAQSADDEEAVAAEAFFPSPEPPAEDAELDLLSDSPPDVKPAPALAAASKPEAELESESESESQSEPEPAAAASEPDVPAPAWEDLPSESEAAWEAEGDVPQFGVALAASAPDAPVQAEADDVASEPPPAVPLPGIAPPDGDLPDFSAWSEPPAADAPTPMPHLFAGDSSSPGDEPLGEAPTTALAPGVLAAHAKAKKGWWPFGKDKSRKPPRTPAQEPPSPDFESFGATPEEPPSPPPIESPAADVPTPPPPPPPRKMPPPPTPRDESRSALDDFLDGLQ